MSYKPLTLVVLIVCIIACSIFVNAKRQAEINLQSVSQVASVKFHKRSGLEALSTSNPNLQRLELRTKTGREFMLDIEGSTPVTSPYYEEIIHDVSQQRRSDEPHLTIISHDTSGYNNCLYHGTVANEPNSVVSINTCNGSITGMIHLRGELYSIEPVAGTSTAVGSDSRSSSTGPHGALSTAALRTLAMSGDLQALAENVPSVLLVDVNQETRIVDEENKRRRTRLNGESIDAQSTTTTSQTHTCASDIEKHHPPLHVLRKMGLPQSSIEAIMNASETENEDVSEDAVDHIHDDADLGTLDNSGKPKRFVEVLLYHDYARLKRFNTTRGMEQADVIAAARADGIALFNNIRSYYLHSNFRFDIQLVLMGHVFFANGDPYVKYLAHDRGTMVISNNGLLETFNRYRNSYGHNAHDVGVLLSGNRFQSNIMGVANVKSLCGGPRWNGNINSITYRNVVKSSVLTAHEIGHTLAANHDARPGYIMNPYVSTDTAFSANSIRAINSHIGSTRCTINNPNTATALDSQAYTGNNFGALSMVDDRGDKIRSNVPKQSYIYTENLHPSLRFDYIDESLINDGWFAQAEYSLPTDEVIVGHSLSEPTVTTTTTPTSTTPITSPVSNKARFAVWEIVLATVSAALVTCALTTSAIIFVLRRLVRDKNIQDFFNPNRTKQLDNSSNDPSDITTPNQVTFTPRLNNRTLGVNELLSPSTPRVTPASPSYSESVRQRRASVDVDQQQHDVIPENQSPAYADDQHRPRYTSNTPSNIDANNKKNTRAL